MKKIKLILLLTLAISVSSCNYEEQNNQDQNDIETLDKLSSEQIDILKKTISSKFEEKKLVITEILNIRKIGNYDVVTFFSNEKEMEIGFENLFEDDGITFSKNSGYTVYCSGDCNCGLEGVLGKEGETYVQCKCTDCQMHYESKRQENNDTKYDLENLAKISFFNTFERVPEKIEITKVASKKYEKADVLTVYYKDTTSEESTFLIIMNNKYEVLNYSGQNNSMKSGGDFTVDCTGSCDCRERFYPGNGSIECTCSPCKMEVKKLTHSGD